jgi:hypothetical protein
MVLACLHFAARTRGPQREATNATHGMGSSPSVTSSSALDADEEATCAT